MSVDSIFKIVYLAGSHIRGTPVQRYLNQLRESQWYGVGEHVEHQLVKIRQLLVHASRHCPFYEKYFRYHGFDPEIASLDDLKKIPPLEKSDLIGQASSIQNNGDGGGLILTETSGTSGQPLTFYRTSGWDAQHRAAILRGLGWFGVNPWMLSGKLWGIAANRKRRYKARMEDFLLHRFREKTFDLSHQTLDAFYQKLKRATYLEGYSSMIFELARHINRVYAGEQHLALKLVKGTSEKVHRHYQDEAVRAFGQKIVNEYGAAEAGIIAFECPEGSLHVNMDHVFVEVEDDEILVTNLLSFSFPFIRYRLGDYVRLRDDTECACGRKTLIIEDITGRVGQTIYGMDGKNFPSLTIYYILKALSLESDLVVGCQAIQNVPGELGFNVVLKRPLNAPNRAAFERTFAGLVNHYYGDSLTFKLNYLDTIPRDGNKMKDFVSHIGEDRG